MLLRLVPGQSKRAALVTDHSIGSEPYVGSLSGVGGPLEPPLPSHPGTECSRIDRQVNVNAAAVFVGREVAVGLVPELKVEALAGDRVDEGDDVVVGVLNDEESVDAVLVVSNVSGHR